MTREGRENLILVALAVSLVLHVVIMYVVRTCVMTHPTGSLPTTPHHVRLQVNRESPTPSPVDIAEIKSLEALREAPTAEGAEQSADVVPPSQLKLPEVAREAPEAPLPDFKEQPGFETKPLSVEVPRSSVMPILRLETPDGKSVPKVAEPYFTWQMPPDIGAFPTVQVAPKLPPIVTKPHLTPQKQEGKNDFKPSEEVYDTVNPAVVASEKEAVMSLIDGGSTVFDLSKFVSLSMVSAQSGEYVYFKVMVYPRKSLPLVPKDVVVLLDASGSIGGDRMVSIRRAAKEILRASLNTNDRFNLVAFRDQFQYAFRRWQYCNQQAFDQADKWLNNVAAHGRTDIFSSISSVLTLPRNPSRPLIALVVTDGDANTGVAENAEILSQFAALNDGLISVYMYGVKSSANRELLDTLTHANRGESFIFDGFRWKAGEGLEGLSERFRDPVLSDLRCVFATTSPAEAYPRLLKNLYRGETVEFYGRVRKGTKEAAFSLRGLNGAQAYEGFFRLPFAQSSFDASIVDAWAREQALEAQIEQKGQK